MPIVVHLDRLLYEREMTLTELSNRVGLTVANLSILKTGKARAVRFSTLEALCRELRCQPGDLLGHVDAEDLEPGDTGSAGGPRAVQVDAGLDSAG
ncbi:MAG: helix-turn-helix transcriptional regulator [Solirubrobacterales bacterium]|nr:helix-turn-helix transcriptional regulator [Solirubrobacterales bacterium]